jgi:hypothetical protein
MMRVIFKWIPGLRWVFQRIFCKFTQREISNTFYIKSFQYLMNLLWLNLRGLHVTGYVVTQVSYSERKQGVRCVLWHLCSLSSSVPTCLHCLLRVDKHFPPLRHPFQLFLCPKLGSSRSSLLCNSTNALYTVCQNTLSFFCFSFWPHCAYFDGFIVSCLCSGRRIRQTFFNPIFICNL